MQGSTGNRPDQAGVQSARGELGTGKYVVGLMFDREYRNVVLILKQKPKWQAGRLNGVGGSIEEGETALEAMRREFYEETGVHTHPSVWHEFLKLDCFNGDLDKGAEVTFFYANDSVYYSGAETKTAEVIMKMPVVDLRLYPRINNLNWLIPMCITLGRDPLVGRYELKEIAA